MDQCLRGVFEGKSPAGDNEDTNLKSPEQCMSSSVSATLLCDTEEQPQNLYTFYCQSMPSSPEKLQQKRKSIVGINIHSCGQDKSSDKSINNSVFADECPLDIADSLKYHSPLNKSYSDFDLCGNSVNEENIFNFNENHIEDKNREKESLYVLLKEQNRNDDKENIPLSKSQSDVIKICLIPPVVDENNASEDTNDTSEQLRNSCEDLFSSEQGNFVSQTILPFEFKQTSTPNSLSVTSATIGSKNNAGETPKQDGGLMSNTSSSLLDAQMVSEGDLTLDETDDTLEGDISQDCIYDSPDTTSPQEKAPSSLFRKPAFRIKRNKSSKGQNSFTKCLGKRKKFRNTFRLKRITTTNQNGHTKSHDCTQVANKHILSKKTASNEKKASKVLGIIFVVFVLLWTPFFLVNILIATCPSCVGHISADGFSLFVWMGYVASLANPIIYTMFNTAFRRTFINILTCRMDRSRQSYHRRTPCPSYTTMIPSDRRNTMTLLLRDESR